jgi:hypothetical protein
VRGAVGQLAIVENGQLHVENGRFLGARLRFGAGTQVAQSLARARSNAS